MNNSISCPRCNGVGRVNSFPVSESRGVIPAPDSDETLRDLSEDFTSVCGRCNGTGQVVTLESLKASAKESAQFRGHVLGAFRHSSLANGTMYADCVNCGAWVQIDAKPLPNDIEIGGTAVALSCTKS